MEIGSFIELQLPKGREHYKASADTARLNTGRSAICHALRVSGCRTIWIPVYQCDSVRDALTSQGAVIKYYRIDERFNPVDLNPGDNEAVLLVNYFGIMSHRRMSELAAGMAHPIIDNCQAFFCDPVAGALNVYSCRKFIGVPDGAYVIGPGAGSGLGDYPQGYSSDTAAFLLTRIEHGCEGKGYSARKLNEERIDSEGIMLMSPLTRAILDGTDYGGIIEARQRNFLTAHRLLGSINMIDPLRYFDDTTVPMVYPLVVENDGLLDALLRAKHFQGHWWSYICDEQPADTFEHWMSRYVIPVTIDQRYSEQHLNYLSHVIHTHLSDDK